MTEVFDEYGNYIYPTDVVCDEPNTVISCIPTLTTIWDNYYDNYRWYYSVTNKVELKRKRNNVNLPKR